MLPESPEFYKPKDGLCGKRTHNPFMSIPEKRVAVLDVVGLTKGTLKHMPALQTWISGRTVQSFPPVFPALTCPAQSTYITGLPPEGHSCVANGWYSRRMSEPQFWKQSNALVQGPRLWEELKRRFGNEFTCAKLFWWYNMYSSADWTITPRPMYPADGRKVFDIYTQPMPLREQIKRDLGEFPFHTFWGPKSGMAATEWIARSAQWIEQQHHPHLSLVYLPYLDYDLQRYGPEAPESIASIVRMGEMLANLVDFYERHGVEVILLSEYGISDVGTPVAVNRLLRDQGWLAIKSELGRDMLDCGASKAFAIADHQIAQIYINDPSVAGELKALLDSHPDIEQVILNSPAGQSPETADRLADITAVARQGAWFSYYFWTDDDKAPDYARCVDIHRKPGYDPAEMFIDERIRFPMARAALFLLKKKLGLRALLQLTPLHGRQVRGSHGRNRVPEHEQPVFISSRNYPVLSPTDVHAAILATFDPD